MSTTKLKSPTSVTLNLTSKCNHNCPFCFNDWRKDGLSETISKKNLDRFADIMHENEIFQVNISGGEPTCEKDILLYAIKTLNSKNLDVSINSNLSTTVNKDLLSQLKNAGVSGIITSLPNYKKDKCNETIGVDAYDTIISNIKHALDLGITIKVNTIVTDDLSHLYNTAAFLKSIGVDFINCAFPAPPDYLTEKELESYKLTADKILALADILLKINSSLNMKVGCVVPFPLCVLNDISKYLPLLDSACKAGVNYMRVDWNGSIHACTTEKESYGNLFESPFTTLWDNLQLWRDRTNLNKNCQTCPIINYCGGECRQFSKFFPNHKYVDKVKLKNWKSIDSNPIPLNKTSTYKINEKIKVRKEEFGATIHVLYLNNAYVDHSGFQLFNLLSELKTFTLNDIEKFVNPSENLSYLLGCFLEKQIIIKS